MYVSVYYIHIVFSLSLFLSLVFRFRGIAVVDVCLSPMQRIDDFPFFSTLYFCIICVQSIVIVVAVVVIIIALIHLSVMLWGKHIKLSTVDRGKSANIDACTLIPTHKHIRICIYTRKPCIQSYRHVYALSLSKLVSWKLLVFCHLVHSYDAISFLSHCLFMKLHARILGIG